MPSTDPPGHVAVNARELGKRYRRGWALRHCSVQLPGARMVALVGHNGAGKSTLMGLLAGLLAPSEGAVEVLGQRPTGAGVPVGVSYLAQGKPLYPGLTVAETLRLGARTNPRWDQGYAERLVREAAVPLEAKIRHLSGGQRTRVALALVLGKRPGLLMLDEPLADLDPVARQATLRTLREESRQNGITVLLSSHVLGELDEVCDHLLLLGRGKVRVAGDIGALKAGHRILRGPVHATVPVRAEDVIDDVALPQGRAVVARHREPVRAPGWHEQEPQLKDIALAYMRRDDMEVEV
ncbi:ATP-binding cassette domain-containing protein [Saccharopolyspora spinosa]|uniref:ABC-2 type transport system ATP-binding protein n=1 Tax=Saccharopolyspora spinosa TaxID=60894 RepID=A0A2N3XR51_SACSN|nr:ABC transporter ATP-binding protein [Saccharopolyspora spinosa]PKW13164.1 ABC-2 type transport system ATP-binding protein [Saccharopolyspora spinosa]